MAIKTNSVVIVNFEVESEAYQALSELKREAVTEDYVVSQACVVKKEEGGLKLQDGFDTGVETRNDALRGGLLGALVGIIGGPLGVLLGYAGGSLVGLAVDGSDTAKNVSLIGQVADSMEEGKTSLIALVSEKDQLSFDVNFTKFDAHITRLDAAEVAAEVEKAQAVQKQLQKEARAQLREDKKDSFRAKVEQHRARLEAEFEEFKADFDKKNQEFKDI